MWTIWAKLGAQTHASWQICMLSLTLTPTCLGANVSGILAWSLREPQRRGRGFLFRWEVRGQPVSMERKRQTLDTAQRQNCLEFSMETLSGFFSSSSLIQNRSQHTALKSTWTDMTYIGIPCTIALNWASQMLPLSQFEGLWQPCIEQVYQYHFPITFAHFMSLHHILIILAIFQAFSLLSYLLQWSVISDIWCYYYD